MIHDDNPVWSEKYRPHQVKDTILPKQLKQTFQKFVDDNNVPNLLLSGGAGVGKTTIAKAMLDEIGADYITINGSMNGNIDTLRVEIANFASTVSFTGGRKYVILDEADYLNAQSTQPALRGFMQDFSSNCGFILTCNFKNRIIEPLHSRCSVIEFKIPSKEKPSLASQFFKRVTHILENEGVEYDKSVVAEMVSKYFPDWRRCLNELQRYSALGDIDKGILIDKTNENFDELFSFLKEKNYTKMRQWVANNPDMDSTTLYKTMYDELPERLDSTASVVACVLTLADYQYKEAFCSNSEINRVACLAQIMVDGDFK